METIIKALSTITPDDMEREGILTILNTGSGFEVHLRDYAFFAKFKGSYSVRQDDNRALHLAHTEDNVMFTAVILKHNHQF